MHPLPFSLQGDMELTREHFRAMIFYDYKVGLTGEESFARLSQAFGDSTVSRATVFNWFREFRCGRASLDDDPRSGRPPSAITQENVAAVQQLVNDDPHVTYEMIEDILDIGSPAVMEILHECLEL